MDINQLLGLTIERNASDLHLVAGHYPTLRIDGVLYPLTTLPILTKQTNQEIIYSFLTSEQKEDLLANKEIDIGYEYNEYRLRINVYFARGTINASFRVVPIQIKTIEELNLPTVLSHLSEPKQGLVLLTGATGQGKSTTLATIINQINMNYSKHIITIEDPIEFVYPPGKSLISQRELRQDTHSWNIALRHFP